MLLILEPLTFIFLAVNERICSKALAFPLLVVSFIDIAVLPLCDTFAMRFARLHLAIIGTPVFGCA